MYLRNRVSNDNNNKNSACAMVLHNARRRHQSNAAGANFDCKIFIINVNLVFAPLNSMDNYFVADIFWYRTLWKAHNRSIFSARHVYCDNVSIRFSSNSIKFSGKSIRSTGKSINLLLNLMALPLNH